MRCTVIALLVLVSVMFITVINARDFWKNHKFRTYHRNIEQHICTQEEKDCLKCIEKSQECIWCSVNGIADGQCTMAQQGCPNTNQGSRSCANKSPEYDESDTTDDGQAEMELQSLSVVADAPVKTENASLFCAVSQNCSTCINQEVCYWCGSSDRCYSFVNNNLTNHICPESQWYRNQCRYKALTKPCPLRNASCDDCLSDGLCYWCASSSQCAYYPHKDYKPADCPRDQVYHDNCKSYGHLFIVLLPILCIIFIPIIIYIVLWLVLCCMRQAGYDPLKPDDDDKPRDVEKDRKSIKLQHDSAPSKTDELRQKYGLLSDEKQ